MILYRILANEPMEQNMFCYPNLDASARIKIYHLLRYCLSNLDIHNKAGNQITNNHRDLSAVNPTDSVFQKKCIETKIIMEIKLDFS